MYNIIEKPFKFNNQPISVIKKYEILFRAQSVAKSLGYTDTDQAIRKCVPGRQKRLTRRNDGSGQIYKIYK